MFRTSTDDQIQTLAAVPAAVANYVKVTGDQGGAFRQLTLTLTNVPLSVTDASAYGSVKLLTLPEGQITLLSGIAKALAFTTTSAIASTLNSGVTVQYGLGTAAASATTLATTMINVAPGSGQTVPTFTSSTTINVASTAVNSILAAPTNLDGTGTALPIYLNVAVGTATDIDGDATLTVSGTVILTFTCNGDV